MVADTRVTLAVTREGKTRRSEEETDGERPRDNLGQRFFFFFIFDFADQLNEAY